MVQFVTAQNAFVDFRNLDLTTLLDGDITSHSSTQLILDLGPAGIETFTGTGFTYNGFGDPIGGTITGIRETEQGQLVFEFTGMNTSVAQFVDWVLRGADSEAYASVLGGDDNLSGGGANDYLGGFGGHDNLFGGAGSDSLEGGSGNDHLYGQSASGGSDLGDLIYGEGGSDYIQGNAGNDSLDGGDGFDRIQGGRDEDSIRGGEGNDTINGNLGNDTIDGGTGSDFLRGGRGNDSLIGNDGDDLISGDLGSDTLSGGSGADIFVSTGAGSTLAAPDRITDFADGLDHFSIGYIASAVIVGNSQNDFANASALAQQLFDNRAGTGEAASIGVGTDTYIFFSSNGGATADSAILLTNHQSPSTIAIDDFVAV